MSGQNVVIICFRMGIFLGKKGIWMSLRRADDGEYAMEYSFLISTGHHEFGAA